MISIINGKRYNTKTATLVAEDSYLYASDFRHYTESLYRTPKGAWFLHGIGGPMTRWGEGNMQDGRSGGEGTEVLSSEEAQAWLESHEEVSALEEYFSDGIEDA